MMPRATLRKDCGACSATHTWAGPRSKKERTNRAKGHISRLARLISDGGKEIREERHHRGRGHVHGHISANAAGMSRGVQSGNG